MSDDVVVGSVSDPLTSASLRWLNGTYTGCINRSGSWSARIAGADPMDHAPLTVSRNDSGCQLRLTAIVADQTYTPDAPIPLSSAYAGAAASFGSGGAQFKANAKLDTATFSSDFAITLVYSDTPSTQPNTPVSSVTGTYVTNQSSVAASLVAPPLYTIDTNDLRFTADALQLVISLAGQAVLTNAGVAGSVYAIDSGTLAENPTYAQTAAAFNAAASSHKPITGSPQAIPASEFGIAALSLVGTYQTRNVIVRRTVGGIATYQIFRILFTA